MTGTRRKAAAPRAKKAPNKVAAEDDGDDYEDAPPTGGTKRKAAAPRARKAPNKVTAEDDGGEYEEAPAAGVAKRARRPAPAPVPRSLPPRKRNEHPGVPDQPRPKRSSDVVAAETSLKEDRLRRLAELDAERIRMVAEMELEDEAEATLEANSVIKNIADLDVDHADSDTPAYNAPPEFTGQAAMSDEEDYTFTGGPMSEDDATETPVAKSLVPPKKPTKRGKGETRGAVDDAKTKMKGKQRDLIASNSRLQPLYPTWLDDGWRNKVSLPAVRPTKPADQRANSKNLKADGEVLGGLTDQDARATAPAKGGPLVMAPAAAAARRKSTTVPNRDFSRSNDTVHVLDESSDEEVVIVKKSRVAPRAIKGNTSVKAEPRSTGALAHSSSSTLIASSSPSAPTIPSSVEGRWRNATLPTLTHLLGSSLSPFECGSDFDELADTFKAANLASMYQLKVGCPVYNKARSRLYDRRGMFGVRATVVVAELFASPAFMLAEDPVLAISEYAEYALRPDGPMFYRVPAPQFIEQGQPGYEKPIDFGEGALFIKILKPFVQKMKQSKKDYGRPYGAIGLAFAALEKTFMMYTTGTLVSDDDAFSRDKVGDPVVDYVSNALEFPLRRWDRIMAACGIVPRNAAPSQPVASSSRLNRRDLYIASSP